MRLREHHAIGEGRIDILYAKPAELLVEDGYNVRDLSTAEARAELDELKAQIKEHGVQTPLKVRFDGTNIFIVEGHRRQKVVLELIEEFQASGGKEGCDIELVPIFKELPGTNEIDRDFGLETSNSGTKLKPLELANLIYRLKTVRGLSLEAIAKGLGKSLHVVKNHLDMRAMPEPVKQHVRDGEISATLASRIAKGSDPDQAKKLIEANLEENRRIKGKTGRATPKGIQKAAEKAKPDKLPVPPPRQAVEPPASEPQPDPTKQTIGPRDVVRTLAEEVAASPPEIQEAVVAAFDGLRDVIDDPVAIPSRQSLNGFFTAVEPFAKAIDQMDFDAIADDQVVNVEMMGVDLKRFSAAWLKATGGPS